MNHVSPRSEIFQDKYMMKEIHFVSSSFKTISILRQKNAMPSKRLELQLTFVDKSCVTLGTGYRHFIACQDAHSQAKKTNMGRISPSNSNNNWKKEQQAWVFSTQTSIVHSLKLRSKAPKD